MIIRTMVTSTNIIAIMEPKLMVFGVSWYRFIHSKNKRLDLCL